MHTAQYTEVVHREPRVCLAAFLEPSALLCLLRSWAGVAALIHGSIAVALLPAQAGQALFHSLTHPYCFLGLTRDDLTR